MADPSTPADRRQERRTAYLTAAIRLFDTHGFAGTSMDMIVAEVGGSKATLYSYFPSKDSLIAGVMEQLAEWIPTTSDDFRGDERPLAHALTDLGTAALRGVTSPDATTIVRLALGEYGRFPELARTVWEHGPALSYARFHRFLEERERRGELIVDDRQLAAEQFIAGIVGHLQLKVAMGIAEPPDDPEVEQRVASAVRTFLARYGTNPSGNGR